MGWNYRIVREKLEDGRYYFAIHEAYYTEGNPVPDSLTAKPVVVEGDTFDDIRWALENMAKALTKPVLEFLPTSDGDKITIVEVQER